MEPRPCSRPRYPSDLTARQWDRVSLFLPAERRVGRRRTHVLRNVLDAINYRWETGCTWRMLPHDFPPWGTVYTYFRTWQRTGVLRQVRDALVSKRTGRPGERWAKRLNPENSDQPGCDHKSCHEQSRPLAPREEIRRVE